MIFMDGFTSSKDLEWLILRRCPAEWWPFAWRLQRRRDGSIDRRSDVGANEVQRLTLRKELGTLCVELLNCHHLSHNHSPPFRHSFVVDVGGFAERVVR
jgi:hypothetical protein